MEGRTIYHLAMKGLKHHAQESKTKAGTFGEKADLRRLLDVLLRETTGSGELTKIRGALSKETQGFGRTDACLPAVFTAHQAHRHHKP